MATVALMCLTVCMRVLKLETKPGTLWILPRDNVLSPTEVRHDVGGTPHKGNTIKAPTKEGKKTSVAKENKGTDEEGQEEKEMEPKIQKEAHPLPVDKMEDEEDWNGKCPHQKDKYEKYKCWLPKHMTKKGGHFDQYLSKKADKDKVIFLISVDQGYVDMALNLYETSFQKFNIHNFLYICSDGEAALALKHHGIECFLFEQKGKNEKAADFMSREFVRKTHVKTKIILGALSLGYTVFITGKLYDSIL